MARTTEKEVASMKWETKQLRAKLIRTLFVASTVAAMVLSAIAEATWE